MAWHDKADTAVLHESQHKNLECAHIITTGLRLVRNERCHDWMLCKYWMLTVPRLDADLTLALIVQILGTVWACPKLVTIVP